MLFVTPNPRLEGGTLFQAECMEGKLERRGGGGERGCVTVEYCNVKQAALKSNRFFALNWPSSYRPPPLLLPIRLPLPLVLLFVACAGVTRARSLPGSTSITEFALNTPSLSRAGGASGSLFIETPAVH